MYADIFFNSRLPVKKTWHGQKNNSAGRFSPLNKHRRQNKKYQQFGFKEFSMDFSKFVSNYPQVKATPEITGPVVYLNMYIQKLIILDFEIVTQRYVRGEVTKIGQKMIFIVTLLTTGCL